MKSYFATGLAFLSFAGCATSALNGQLDQKLAQENTVANREDLKIEADRGLADKKGLAPETREALVSLKARTRARLDEIGQKSLRLRAVLVEDLVTPSGNSDEVILIEDRLRDLSSQRLDEMFNTLDRANTLLGRRKSTSEVVTESYTEEQMMFLLQ